VLPPHGAWVIEAIVQMNLFAGVRGARAVPRAEDEQEALRRVADGHLRRERVAGRMLPHVSAQLVRGVPVSSAATRIAPALRPTFTRRR